ncbi:MAG: hypothetical protein ACTXOO_03120 [Sodalis sp. (in: enterobacteria)]
MIQSTKSTLTGAFFNKLAIVGVILIEENKQIKQRGSEIAIAERGPHYCNFLAISPSSCNFSAIFTAAPEGNAG